MANHVASLLIVTIVISVSQGYAQRCSPQQCAVLLNSISQPFPNIEPLDSQNCDESTLPGGNFNEQSYSNQGFNRPPNRLIKDSKNPLRDWMKDWDRMALPSSSSNRREDELYDENNKNSYEEEIQYDDPVPMFDPDRMDTYPFQKPYDTNPDSSLYPGRLTMNQLWKSQQRSNTDVTESSLPSNGFSDFPALDGVKPDSPRYDRISPTLDKNGRRNSDSLRQRSFALSAFPNQMRQVRRTKE